MRDYYKNQLLRSCTKGDPVDEEIIVDHAQSLLHFYVGEGWYRDGHAFDYYSCWAFNVYEPIWCNWYGYEHFPEIAAKFERNSNELMKTYGDFFDADSLGTVRQPIMIKTIILP